MLIDTRCVLHVNRLIEAVPVAKTHILAQILAKAALLLATLFFPYDFLFISHVKRSCGRLYASYGNIQMIERSKFSRGGSRGKGTRVGVKTMCDEHQQQTVNVTRVSQTAAHSTAPLTLSCTHSTDISPS